jgi:hypothetical protein
VSLTETFYISGPMRLYGPPDFNHDQFCAVEVALRTMYPDARVFNPALNFGGDKTLDVTAYLTVDLQQVIIADAVVLLPRWTESEGAILEARVGLATGKRFMFAYPDGDDWQFEPMSGDDVEAGIRVYDSVQISQVTPTELIPGVVRSFGTGATRDSDDGKYDYEGFLSPVVLEAFAAYMHKHRVQSDGSLRDSDNWQKGMPLDVYMKSMWRHFMDVWKTHRGLEIEVSQVDALMALLFNVQGYAFELLHNSGYVDGSYGTADAALETLRRKLAGDGE